jgi:signal recognition particle subunit SRP54
MAKRLQKGASSTSTTSEQLQQMQKLGGMGGMMGMMPGMGKMKKQIDQAGIDDKAIHPSDRHHPIDDAEGTREARCSQSQPQEAHRRRFRHAGADVNKLLKMHRQMADMMKPWAARARAAA